MDLKEQKETIIATLDKVEREELPLFVKDLKAKTLLRVMFGLMTKETGDMLLETCDEYLRDYKQEKELARKLELHNTAKPSRSPVADLSKIRSVGEE